MGQLGTGCYHVAVPEERGAIIAIAWLAERHAQAARELAEELTPFFPALRAARCRFSTRDLSAPRLDVGTVGWPCWCEARLDSQLVWTANELAAIRAGIPQGRSTS